MERDTFNRLIKEISYSLIDADEGNMLLFSNLIDMTEQLKKASIENQYAGSLISILSALLTQVMQEGNLSQQEIKISTAVDLLAKIGQSAEGFTTEGLESDPLLLEDIKNYLQANEEILFKNISKDIPAQSQIKAEEIKPVLQIASEPFKIFLTEAEERIERAQELMLQMETDFNAEQVNELFRVFHTLKGECGFLKLVSFGELAHSVENLLDMIRAGQLQVTPEIIDILLKGVDRSKELIKSLKHGDVLLYNGINNGDFLRDIDLISKSKRKNIGEILKEEGKITELQQFQIAQMQKEKFFSKKFGEIAVEEHIVSKDEIQDSLNHQQEIKKTAGEKTAKEDAVIKVKASQINYLVDMIGELFVIENQMNESDRNVVMLKKISKMIQNAAMQLRTVKVRNLFTNMKRAVREISKTLRKEIILETKGEDLEIDRNLVEILEEPLVHIIRNSCHHGIEEKHERMKSGKDPIGKILLKGERRGNNVVISIRDDGKGLDKEKILSKAIEKGLVSKEQAEHLNAKDIYDFIFMPGFSTADSVNTISGRGVGMDVVKNTVNFAKGRVEIKTEKSLYTEIELIFPLSLAIIEGIIIRLSDRFFIVPVSNVAEIITLEGIQFHTIENRTKVLKLRDEVIRVISLYEFFDIQKKEEDLQAIIVDHQDKKYAILVSEVIAKKEVVIKSLGEQFKNLQGISSCTVLADNKIGFVINVDDIISVKSGF